MSETGHTQTGMGRATAAAAARPTCPTATAAADPPEDPPAVLVVSHGLTVVPHSLLKV
jgi:hypothetical protein